MSEDLSKPASSRPVRCCAATAGRMSSRRLPNSASWPRISRARTTSKPGDKGKLSVEQKAQLDDWRQNRYMLARTYAETAHCLGHLLVLMPKDRSIRADFLPDLVSLFGDQVAEGIRDPDGLADRRKLADRLYALSQEQHKMARQIDPIYKQEWKADLNARLSEVRGYAQFRHAEWLPAKDDKAFKEECNQAVRSLQDAELRKPRHYALLQNIGMIYLSRRFDSPGANLEQAERTTPGQSNSSREIISDTDNSPSLASGGPCRPQTSLLGTRRSRLPKTESSRPSSSDQRARRRDCSACICDWRASV